MDYAEAIQVLERVAAPPVEVTAETLVADMPNSNMNATEFFKAAAVVLLGLNARLLFLEQRRLDE